MTHGELSDAASGFADAASSDTSREPRATNHEPRAASREPRIAFLDGGMGTQLIARGLGAGEIPEEWNLTHAADVRAVHAAYADAGAEIVCTNTFGANRLKYHGAIPLAEVIAAAVANAKASGAKAALDVGPTGRLLKPAGDLDFETAYDAFAEEVRLGAAAGADLIAIETMGDTLELKAAVLAAKENCALPVYATVALGEDGKLLTGADVEAVATLLESLRVDALGFNCGLGPDRMRPFVERVVRVTDLPVVVKPNAGMPRLENGRTVFGVGPDEFARHVVGLVEAGARIVGGCCGTTPAHVAAVRRALADFAPPPRPKAVRATRVSSGTHAVSLASGEGKIIGERINPTGKKRLREALKSGDVAYVLREAVAQGEAGAEILDVNCGVPGLDETAALDATVAAVQSVSDLPIQIDTSSPAALALALRHVNGKPLVNSVNGKRESMDAVFPLVAKCGGAVVALTLDENGIPPTAEGRLAIAERIVAEGAKWGIAKEDFVVDALTLAVSAQPDAAAVTLETVRLVTERLGANTVLGVSNVSFGLPDRPALNAAMLTAAKRAGLSAAIFNPAAPRANDAPAAHAALLGADDHCAAWIAAHAAPAEPFSASHESPTTNHEPRTTNHELRAAIRRGLKLDAAAAAKECLAAGEPPLALIDGAVVPALEEVGVGFEKGTLFLPQLLMAADAASAAFDELRAALAKSGTAAAKRGPIVLATVKGDVHDIGKNIVRSLLENYGFEVVDLGRDVAPERVVEAVRRTGARLVGLSALMTTTVGAMAETTRLVHSSAPGCRVTVGGAVVTEDYAREIGADFYTKDAMGCVRLAERLFQL